MFCPQKTAGLRFILICLIVRFAEVRLSQPNYKNFESRGPCENRDDFNNIENDGFSRTIRPSNFLWLMPPKLKFFLPPVRPMKFRNPEVLSYLAPKKEYDARERSYCYLLDIMKTGIKRKVSFTTQKNLILTSIYINKEKIFCNNHLRFYVYFIPV